MVARVYVLVEGRWGSGGDVGGSLWDDQGVCLWEHVSSSVTWLRQDLTVGFSHRAQTLNEKYPDGYEVVMIDGEKDHAVYDELAAIWDRTIPGWRDR